MGKKIGQLIKERFEASGMEATQFAKLINKERSNVYNIFQRESIDTELLKKIGQVLRYDFFVDLLEPQTKKMLLMRQNITNKVYFECDLSDEELKDLNIEDKIIKFLNK